MGVKDLYGIVKENYAIYQARIHVAYAYMQKLAVITSACAIENSCDEKFLHLAC